MSLLEALPMGVTESDGAMVVKEEEEEEDMTGIVGTGNN